MSKLENQVKNKIRMVINTTMLENVRPDWLISSQGERLELDIYLPELDLAIEVQGRQHYTFTPHFHNNHNGFADQLRRDREKCIICERKGITLLEVASRADLGRIIAKIISMVPQLETNEDFVAKMNEYNKTHPERMKIRRNKKRITLGKISTYRVKLLKITRTIRVINQRIAIISNELSLGNQNDEMKQRRLANLKTSRDQHISCLKKFVWNWSREIRMAFAIHKHK